MFLRYPNFKYGPYFNISIKGSGKAIAETDKVLSPPSPNITAILEIMILLVKFFLQYFMDNFKQIWNFGRYNYMYNLKQI